MGLLINILGPGGIPADPAPHHVVGWVESNEPDVRGQTLDSLSIDEVLLSFPALTEQGQISKSASGGLSNLDMRKL